MKMEFDRKMIMVLFKPTQDSFEDLPQDSQKFAKYKNTYFV